MRSVREAVCCACAQRGGAANTIDDAARRERRRAQDEARDLRAAHVSTLFIPHTLIPRLIICRFFA
jgi:hypothetical protein